MALKAEQKADIKAVFGEGMSTSLFIKLISYFPELLKTVLELIAVWKEHKAKKKSKPDVKAFDEPATCGGLPVPPPRIGKNGYYSCIGGEWTWIEELG